MNGIDSKESNPLDRQTLEDWAQPRWGWGTRALPRLAEYGNPGLEDESPSGKCSNSRTHASRVRIRQPVSG
jgi:hypothetical protein